MTYTIEELEELSDEELDKLKNDDRVSMSIKEYWRFVANTEELNRLIRNGVDNWGGYGENYGDEE